MKVFILPSPEAIGAAIADRIETLFVSRPQSNLGVATGSSPLPVYRELIDRVSNGKLSFSQSHFFMLDEYVGIAADHPERFSSLAVLPMSNRMESTEPGDVLVIMNRKGYWALLMLDDVEFLPGPNGLEPIALMRYVIATDRSDALTLADLPHPLAAGSPEE